MVKPFQINSVTVPLIGNNYLQDSYDDKGLDDFINRILATGADTVSLIVSLVLQNPNSVSYDQGLNALYNPTDSEIASFAKRLQEKGMDITFNPIPLIHDKTDATNLINDRINPTDVNTWMTNHTLEMIRLARQAENIGAKKFIVFTDLEQHMLWKPELTQSWLNLIEGVREVFSGQITSIAWTDMREDFLGKNILDKTPTVVWEALDLIGISPFVEPLTNKLDPTVDELKSSWYENAIGVRSIEFMREFSDRHNKPIYFADRTFRSFDGTNINEGQIFQSTIPLKPDPQEQTDLFESFLRVFSLEQGDWLSGVSFNSVSRFPEQSLDSVARYLRSPVGEDFDQKPAGANLSAWFNGLRQSEGRLFSGDNVEDKDDRIFGGYHHDSLEGGLGNDYLNGGAGTDKAIYSGLSAEYNININNLATTISDFNIVRDGVDTLVSIERAAFKDAHIALDISGTAGQAYRIYEAVLGRAPDLVGLGYWINDMDNGVSLTTIAQGFIASKEFQNKYGVNPSYETYVNLLYQNILGREPDSVGLNYWVSNMKSGIDSPAAVLASFSEGIENTANVAPEIANGIYYTPWLT